MSKGKDYIQKLEGSERRYFEAPVTIETRGEGDEAINLIEGYAFKFNKITTISGWFREEILPGSTDDILDDDIRCLFNHDPSLILARSVKGKGTLTISVDSIGFKYSYVTPDRSYAKDLEDAISKGDVNQSSFAFRAKETVWVDGGEKELDLRQIKKFEVIWDVSPVTYPAYQDTTVAKRSHDTFKALDIDVNVKEDEQRAETMDVYDAQYLYNLNKSK